jgi:hexosaminidase
VTRELIPRPRFVEFLSGTVVWTSPLRVAVDNEWRGVVETFASDLRSAVGWGVSVVAPGEVCDIEILRLPELEDEGYQISVSECTRVEASSEAGVAYALTTLRQLGPDVLWSNTPQELDELVLPLAIIQDAPAFAWRGGHLDVSRHFFGVEVILRFIDLLAAHRLNHLHLHLNDDQGWRVEIPSWPLLTEIGASRRSSPVGNQGEGVDDHVSYGGFFTADDLRTIREHAARRFIQIVPEIDLPGHSQAAIAAYPELGNLSERLEVWTNWGISEHVLNVSAEAIQFAVDAVLYVASLFPESPVHIGGDECPTGEWASSPAALAVMSEHGFRDVRQLQGLFTKATSAALQHAGHEVEAWDDVLDAEVLPGTVIVAWRSSSKAIEGAERGFDVIMAPMQFLYLDWLNSDDPSEPIALAPVPHVTTWERVYGFSVIPPGLHPDLDHHIRGAQAQLWTEYIATREHLDYMAFPRLSAFSEVVWGTATNVDEFRLRLRAHLGRLDAMGVAYRAVSGD